MKAMKVLFAIPLWFAAVFVADNSAGLLVFDVQNPTSPVLLIKSPWMTLGGLLAQAECFVWGMSQ